MSEHAFSLRIVETPRESKVSSGIEVELGRSVLVGGFSKLAEIDLGSQCLEPFQMVARVVKDTSHKIDVTNQAIHGTVRSGVGWALHRNFDKDLDN